VREREDANRTREAGHLDEIQGVVANILNSSRDEASLLANPFGVGFIDWLGRAGSPPILAEKHFRNTGEAYRSDDYCEAKPAPPGWSKRQETQAITQGNKSAKDEKWSCEAAMNATATGRVDQTRNAHDRE